jgi:hypothetical protein
LNDFVVCWGLIVDFRVYFVAFLKLLPGASPIILALLSHPLPPLTRPIHFLRRRGPPRNHNIFMRRSMIFLHLLLQFPYFQPNIDR